MFFQSLDSKASPSGRFGGAKQKIPTFWPGFFMLILVVLIYVFNKSIPGFILK